MRACSTQLSNSEFIVLVITDGERVFRDFKLASIRMSRMCLSRFGCCDNSDVADVGSHDSVFAVLLVIVRRTPSLVFEDKLSNPCHEDFTSAVATGLRECDCSRIRMLNRFGCDDLDVVDGACPQRSKK